MQFDVGNIQYILKMSRPRFWFYLAGPVVVGVSYGASEVGGFFTPTTVLFFLYFLVPANIYLYGVNDLFDREIDKLNPKKSEGGPEVVYRNSTLVKASISISGISSLLLIPFIPPVSIGCILLFLALGFSYSAKGIRFKARPILDSISNGMYILPGLAIYVAVSGSLPPIPIVAGAWVWSMSMHTFSAIPDIDSDREGGVRTTATYLGKRNTLVYCGVLWFVSSLMFALVHLYLSIIMVYPIILGYVSQRSYDISTVYWWYPYINVAVGCLLSLGGVYSTIYGDPTGYQGLVDL